MDLVADRLACTDIDGGIPDRVDTAVFVDEQGDDVVLGRFTQIFKVGARADNIGNIPFDIGHLALLLDNDDGIFFGGNESGEVAVKRYGRHSGKQRVADRIFQYRLAFACKLNVKQFGYLFGFADFQIVIVDFVDFKKGAYLHQHQRIRAVLCLKMALQIEVYLGQKLLFL